MQVLRWDTEDMNAWGVKNPNRRNIERQKLPGEQDENGASVISKLDQPTTLQTAIDATSHIPKFVFIPY
jgi:hypothetical protein